MNYFIRVRMSSEIITPSLEKIDKVCDKMIAYEHSERADNIHCHMMLIGVNVSTDTLKNYIRSCGMVPPRAGNKFWSFKQCDSDLQTPVIYMSKGKLEPFYVKGFTQEEIDSCKDRWVERTPETSQKFLTSYVVRENSEQSKRRQWDNIQEIVKRYNELPMPTGRHLCRIIKQVVVMENHTMLGRYKMRDYYDTVKAIVNEHDWSLSASQFCEKDFF